MACYGSKARHSTHWASKERERTVCFHNASGSVLGRKRRMMRPRSRRWGRASPSIPPRFRSFPPQNRRRLRGSLWAQRWDCLHLRTSRQRPPAASSRGFASLLSIGFRALCSYSVGGTLRLLFLPCRGVKRRREMRVRKAECIQMLESQLARDVGMLARGRGAPVGDVPRRKSTSTVVRDRRNQVIPSAVIGTPAGCVG